MKDFLTFLIFIFLINPGSYCQNLSTEGDDFWVAFMENWLQDPNNPMHLEIYISADDSTTGVLEMPGMENSLPPVDFTIVPGRSLIIPIPTDLAMMAGTDQVQNKGIHIKTKKRRQRLCNE